MCIVGVSLVVIFSWGAPSTCYIAHVLLLVQFRQALPRPPLTTMYAALFLVCIVAYATAVLATIRIQYPGGVEYWWGTCSLLGNETVGTALDPILSPNSPILVADTLSSRLESQCCRMVM